MLLDHLTHGRIIGGMGPGSLPTDAAMIGLTPIDTRELLETNLDIVVRLLKGETVSAKTATHELQTPDCNWRPTPRTASRWRSPPWRRSATGRTQVASPAARRAPW